MGMSESYKSSFTGGFQFRGGFRRGNDTPLGSGGVVALTAHARAGSRVGDGSAESTVEGCLGVSGAETTVPGWLLLSLQLSLMWLYGHWCKRFGYSRRLRLSDRRLNWNCTGGG